MASLPDCSIFVPHYSVLDHVRIESNGQLFGLPYDLAQPPNLYVRIFDILTELCSFQVEYSCGTESPSSSSINFTESRQASSNSIYSAIGPPVLESYDLVLSCQAREDFWKTSVREAARTTYVLPEVSREVLITPYCYDRDCQLLLLVFLDYV